MKIELKNVKYSKSLSQETNAFTATVYVNGKKAGSAENHGQGGNTNVWLNELPADEAKAVEAYCLALPPIEYPSEIGQKPFVMKSNLESVVDDLLEAYLDEKYGETAQFKKWIKKDVCFRIKGDKPLSWRIIKKANGVYTKAVKAHIEQKYVGTLEEILNDRFETAV